MTSSSPTTAAITTTTNNNQDRIKHDVFLSFRGEDTRYKFTAHLHKALNSNGIDAYIDTRLNGGEKIDTLYTKVTECSVTVVIFSPRYADSRWCLGELNTIVGCMETRGQRVLPVFLGVKRTDVSNQTGEFGECFKGLLEETKENKMMEDTWKRAMIKIADIPGWDSEEKSEDQIVEEVVTHIEKSLYPMSAHDLENDGFVGSGRVLEVESLLRIDSAERVHSVGISGSSGIGKTQIAQVVFNRKSKHFDGACFLENIAEKYRREGLDSLQKEMITQLFGPENARAGLHIFSSHIQRKLKRKRVLIVLDDVGTAQQLKTLFFDPEFYASGSRIIVTSKEIQVLKSGCKDVYEVKKLNDHEAFQLFKRHAFNQEQPTGKFIELSKKAVDYANGLPSVLENLGCNLFGKSIEEWESELAKLQETLDMETTANGEVEEKKS